MKAVNVLLMALVTALMACSNGGGSGDNKGGKTDFEPSRKPENAVSNSDLKYYQQFLKTADQHLPKDEAVFTVTLAGSKSENVQPEKRDEALARLNADGQQIVRMMQSRCTINQAISTTTGDTEMRVGSKQTEVGAMSIVDTGACPYAMNKNVQSENVITGIDGNATVVHIKSNTTMVDTTVRFVKSDFLTYRTNLRSTSLVMNSRAQSNFTMSNDSVAMQATVTGTGTLDYALVDGDFVRGPITFEADIDSTTKKMNMQYLFDLQTSRGALRIVMIGTEAVQDVYVNGEKVNPGDFGPLYKAAQPKAQDISALQVMAKKLLQ